MITYAVHYIDGDNEVFEAEEHIVENDLYILKDIANDDGKYVEVDLVIRNIFSIRRETEE